MVGAACSARTEGTTGAQILGGRQVGREWAVGLNTCAAVGHTVSVHRCQGRSPSCFPKGVVAEGKRFMKGVSNLQKGDVQSSSSLLGRELASFSRQSL